MNLPSLVCLNYIGIVCIIFLFYFASTNIVFDKKWIKLFFAIASVNLVLIILDMIEYYFECQPGENYFAITQILICLCYAINPILPFLLNLQYRKSKKLFIASVILLCANATISIAMCICKISNSSYLPYNTVTSIIQSVIALAFFMLMAFGAVSNTSVKNKSGRLFMALLYIVVFVAFLLEVLCAFRFLLWNITAVFLVIYYLYFHSIMLRNDILTGLSNRQVFEKDISADNQKSVYVVVFDINNLKTINDTQGHSAGDQLIKNTADTIKKCFTKGTTYRIGGDEFVYLSNENLSEAEFKNMVDNFNAINTTHSIAFGFALSTPTKSILKAFNQADDKMYENKAKYKNI